jgi:hypothetical protein
MAEMQVIRVDDAISRISEAKFPKQAGFDTLA